MLTDVLDMKMGSLPLIWVESWNYAMEEMISKFLEKIGANYTTWDKLSDLIVQ